MAGDCHAHRVHVRERHGGRSCGPPFGVACQGCSLVVGQFLDDMVRVKQRLLDEVPHMRVVNCVEQPVTVASYLDHVGHAQFREVLRHSRRLQPKMFRKLADCVLTVQQRPDDPQTRVVGEDLQRLYGQLELVVAR